MVRVLSKSNNEQDTALCWCALPSAACTWRQGWRAASTVEAATPDRFVHRRLRDLGWTFQGRGALLESRSLAASHPRNACFARQLLRRRCMDQGARMAPRGAPPPVWDTQAHDWHRRAVSASCITLPLRSPGIRSPVRPSRVSTAVYSCYLGHLCTIRPESVRFVIDECAHRRRPPGADRLHPWAWSTPSNGRPSRPRVPDLQTGKHDTPARPTCTGGTEEVVPLCPARAATMRGACVAHGPSMEVCASTLFSGPRTPAGRESAP